SHRRARGTNGVRERSLRTTLAPQCVRCTPVPEVKRSGSAGESLGANCQRFFVARKTLAPQNDKPVTY
ncbi:MAG: hypothetical protein ABI621_18655, partial [Chloroflexota bacterium]